MQGNGSVLVVEDDPDVRRMLADYLGSHGYEVAVAANGAAMNAALERALPDVVLLDLNLGGEDGLMLARELRTRHPAIGIIMVTAASDVVDRIVGLEVGADDYVAKPFDPRELRARLKSVIRRVRETVEHEDRTSPAQPPGSRKRFGSFVLDLAAHRLIDASGTEVSITTMEFDLLRTFVEHPNQVLSRDRLLTLTRNREWEPFDRSIDIRIARLRRKVEADPEHPALIRTIRGSGYIYVPAEG